MAKYPKMMEEAYLRAGFIVKAKIYRNIAKAEFCSGIFVPIV